MPTKRPLPMSAQIAMIDDLETRNHLADIAINQNLAILNRLVDEEGKKGGKYWNFIIRELDALGYDRDYSPWDTGCGPDEPR